MVNIRALYWKLSPWLLKRGALFSALCTEQVCKVLYVYMYPQLPDKHILVLKRFLQSYNLCFHLVSVFRVSIHIGASILMVSLSLFAKHSFTFTGNPTTPFPTSV